MKHHKHPICKICDIEIKVGDSVYECKNDDCGAVVHQECYKNKKKNKFLFPTPIPTFVKKEEGGLGF